MICDHPLQKRVLRYSQRNRLFPSAGEHVLVALSGGPDSVALLDILVSLRQCLGISQLTTIHCNHKLRSGESELDEAFVRRISESLGLNCLVFSEDVSAIASAGRVSIEMAARQFRHGAFRKAREETGAQLVALGHTASDQSEELLIRLFRGTGPGGLRGMLPCGRDGLVRPLFFATRGEINSYNEDRALSWRMDSSNLQPFCARNALRLEILPAAERYFHTNITKTISRHAAICADEEDFWGGLLQDAWGRLSIQQSESEISFDAAELSSLHVALLRRVLRRAIESLQGHLQRSMLSHVEACLKLVTGSSGSGIAHLPSGVVAERDRHLFRIRTSPQPGCTPFQKYLLLDSPGQHRFGEFILNLGTVSAGSLPAQLGRSPACIAHLDADRVIGPLVVRGWQPGDRFKPLGMKGTRKVHDFFIDKKVPRKARSRIPIVCDSEKICWVAGYRMDDRVKVTSETRRVQILSIEPFSEPVEP